MAVEQGEEGHSPPTVATSSWEEAHRRVLLVLLGLVPLLVVIGLARGVPAAHVVADIVPALVAAGVAVIRRVPGRARAVTASVGLMAVAGAFVHLSGGRTEAHFVYFVLLGLLAIYDDWAPYAAAVLVVLVEHAVVGALAPEALYDGRAAQHQPWAQAAVHGGAVLAASAIGLVVWRWRDTAQQSSRARQWASDEGLRITFDAAPIGMALVDLDGLFTRVNTALCALVGRSASALVGTSFREITHPDDIAKDMHLLRECLSGERDGYTMEKRYLHIDGHPVWVQLSVAVARNASGELSHFVAQVLDVTERRAADEALASSEARFAAMVEHGSDLMSITDAAGSLVYASPAYLTQLGFDPAERLGTPLHDFVHPDDLPLVTETALALGPHPGSSAIVEIRFAHADGSWRWFEATVTNRLHDPAVDGFVVNSRDVTDRVQAAERLTHEATHDALTGLANRALLDRRLAEAATGAAQAGEVLAAVFVDVDHFKVVNDTYGHHVGDAVLEEVAVRLVNAARREDTVARLGGDEFVILARVGSAEDAAALADRACRSFWHPIEVGELRLEVLGSVGLATSFDAPLPSRLLEAADRALYEAKARGRARWATYVPTMGWHAPELGRLETPNVADPSAVAARQRLGEQYQDHVTVAEEPIVVHVDGLIVAASPAVLELMEVEREQVIGRDVREFVTPQSTGATEARRRVFANGGWPAPEVYELETGQGRHIGVEVTSTPTLWMAEMATQLTLRPVADRWEEILRIGSTLSSASTHAVVITELDERIVSWNDGAAALYGWSSAEALGKRFRELVPSERPSPERHRMYQTLRTTGRWKGIATHVRQNGSLVVTDASVEMINDREGRRIGMMLVAEPCRRGSEQTDLEAALLAEVETAIHEGQLVIAYQPIVDRAGRTLKVEALVRWQHPTRGLLYPGAFIPVVEHSSLIGVLTGHVLQQACGQLADWRRRGWSELEVSVNVSARELGDPSLPDRVGDALAASGLPAEALWVEVTETALAETDRSGRVVAQLCATGVRLALDDFGIGFATLAQLHRFPAHALKIDRLFVEGMTGDSGDAAIVRSVLALGRELGLLVIAEGVERDDQRMALEAMGCELFQGYLFARPSFPAAAVQWLTSTAPDLSDSGVALAGHGVARSEG